MAFGGGFGASGFDPPSSGFGNPSQPLFGQPSNPFGQSTSSFGNFAQSAPSFGQSAPAFGQPAPQFGQSTPAFGQSTPVFGQSASSFGNFGASQPSLWGQSSAAFGASQSLGSSQLFGASQPAFGAQSQSLFGSSQPMSNQSQALGAQSQFGSGWGSQNQQSQQPPSTRSVKYQISHLYDTNSTDTSKFMAISAMEQFQPYSMEELRVADYARGDKSGGASTGMAGNAGFGAQSGGTFGGSAFGSQSQSGFGAQSQSLFGGQSQPGLFGNSSGGANGVGSSSGGLFGSNQNPTQGGFGSGGGGGVFGNTGFGSSGFGQSSAAASGFGAFGSTAQSQSLFSGGNQQSSGGLFGAQPQSGGGLFGSQPQSGAGLFSSQQSGGGLFGGQQSGGGLFGGQQSGGGLFGGQQSGGGLFGAQSQTGGAPFGTSSSALGGTGGGLFGGQQQGAQSAPSLFGTSTGSGIGNAGLGASGGLFGGQTGNSLLGNTGGSLFGTGASFGGFASSSPGLFGAGSGSSLFGGQAGGAASSSSLFGSGFAGGFGSGFGTHNANNFQQQQQQQQGPLEATLTKDPYGQSQLFSSATNQLTVPSKTLAIQPTAGVGAGKELASKDIRVVVDAKAEPARRMRGFETIARQEVLLRASGVDGRNTSPVRYWGPRRSLLDTKRPRGRREHETNSRSSAVEWRNEEQKRKAASIRKLVIQPMEGDPILKAASGQGFLRGKGPIRRPTSERLNFNRSSSVGSTTEALERDLREGSGRPRSFPIRTAGSEQRRPSDADETAADAETSIESDPAEDNGTENLTHPAADTQTFPVPRETLPPSTEVEQFNSRYVPYKDYYKTQMRRTRQGTEHDTDERRPSRIIRNNSASALQTSPSITSLDNMSPAELSRVESFKVWKPMIGEIVWQEPVDLRGVNLDHMIRIEPKEVCIYPREEDLPDKGKGLNKPAIIRLHGIWKKDKDTGQPSTDASTVAAIVKKLKARCEEERLEFLGYEVRTGTWTFKAHSF